MTYAEKITNAATREAKRIWDQKLLGSLTDAVISWCHCRNLTATDAHDLVHGIRSHFVACYIQATFDRIEVQWDAPEELPKEDENVDHN